MRMLLLEIHSTKECLYLLKERLQEGKFTERDFNTIEDHINLIEEKAISLISTM